MWIKIFRYSKKKIKNPSNKIINAWLYHRRQFNVSILTGIIKSNTVNQYYNEYKKCIKNLKKDIFIPLKVGIPFKRKIYSLLISINPVLFINVKIKRKRKNVG